jgi:GTP pyrophosphokinase
MRTLEHLPEEKQRAIAQETREIYAPLAHRFGMAGIRSELEDLSFKFLESDDYRALVEQIQAKREERQEMIERLRVPLEEALRSAGIEDYEIAGRPKHLWSIYKKMLQRHRPFEEIYDLMAFRVLVETVPDCYHALGVIHHKWTPLQERIKDYIASPKSNGYQSLHTTIFGPGGQLYEIQIRTREMHWTADFGIAAHWVYKESARARCTGPRTSASPPTGSTRRARSATSWTDTSSGSASCSSCSRMPTRPRSSSSSSRSISTRTRSSCSRRAVT